MKTTIRKPLCFSEIGRKDNQEDCIYPSVKDVNVQNHFFILCDGMGGHENGEVASTTVCTALGEYFKSNTPEDEVMTPDLFKKALEYAYDELDKKDTGGVKKMGTTMTCLYLHKKGYLVAHIGDSRIYHIRPNSGILYQSSDHSLVNDLLRVGELTEEEAVNFPQKNIITRAMQPNLERRCRADIFSFNDIHNGDFFFLCSDGVLEQVTNDDLCKILSNNKTNDSEKLNAIKQICDGKTRDNYTCFLIPIDNVVLEEEDADGGNEDLIVGVTLEEDEVSTHSSKPTTVAHNKSVENPSNPVKSNKKPGKIGKLLFSIALLALVLICATYYIMPRHAKTQYILGVCYSVGLGVEQDYNEAVKWYRKAAEQGDAEAQNNLGVCYVKGLGVEQDYNEAVKWYRKAAEQGNAKAQNNLGVCYVEGEGVEQDYNEAVKWFREAAEQGLADAQFNLGVCYVKGLGVEQDYNEAVKWCRKAAEQGDVRAQFNLGGCYEKGQGVEQDYNEAVKWYRKAAEQGLADAQYFLGKCYDFGKGVEQSYEEAAKWYRKAAEQGNSNAKDALKILGK